MWTSEKPMSKIVDRIVDRVLENAHRYGEGMPSVAEDVFYSLMLVTPDDTLRSSEMIRIVDDQFHFENETRPYFEQAMKARLS